MRDERHIPKHRYGRVTSAQENKCETGTALAVPLGQMERAANKLHLALSRCLELTERLLKLARAVSRGGRSCGRYNISSLYCRGCTVNHMLLSNQLGQSKVVPLLYKQLIKLSERHRAMEVGPMNTVGFRTIICSL
jgi:hypothetical protein